MSARERTRRPKPGKPERAPAGTGPAGRWLWRAVLAEYELEAHELLLRREAVHTVDLLDTADATVRAEGTTLDSPHAGERSHVSVPCSRHDHGVTEPGGAGRGHRPPWCRLR